MKRDGKTHPSRRFPAAHALCALLVLAWTAAPAPAQPVPLPRAHAHNDYEHARPLLDALARGFCSVEADVHLVRGKLLVAHHRLEARPSRTLEALYLEPLREQARRGGGRVYPGGPSLTLLIDIKTDADATYAVLRRVLDRYADILTVYTGETVRERAVTVILSGNRPRAALEAERVRLAAFDGRLPDLDAAPPAPAAFMPLVSAAWGSVSRWNGRGEMPEADRRRVAGLVRRAHAQGRRIRFWATPETPAAWAALLEAGVDLINTDDLDGLRRFLLARRPATGGR